MNKKIMFEIHSWIGINLSLLFFIVCFSGTMATLSHELDWLVNPEMRAKPISQRASRNYIVKNLEARYPDGKILYWAAETEPYSCQIVQLEENGRRLYVFVNPYTGLVQGDAAITFQRFFRDFHYFLFMPLYQFGYFVVLVFAFFLFTSTLTALFFYKKWWTKLLGVKTGKGPLVLIRSLHRLGGVWSLPFALLLSQTGIWYFLERTNSANISDIANPKNPFSKEMGLDSSQLHQLSYRLDYDKAAKIAQQNIPNLQVRDISPPAKNDGVIYLTGVSGEVLVRNRANRVYLHPLTYEVLGVQKASELNTITWLNDIADPLHFGTWGGLLTKVVWFLAGLVISGLVLTGVWISLKRRLMKKSPLLPFWKYLNWSLVALIVVSMYTVLYKTYEAPAKVFLLVSLALLFFGLAGWLFSYRLSKAVQTELAREVPGVPVWPHYQTHVGRLAGPDVHENGE